MWLQPLTKRAICRLFRQELSPLQIRSVLRELPPAAWAAHPRTLSAVLYGLGQAGELKAVDFVFRTMLWPLPQIGRHPNVKARAVAEYVRVLVMNGRHDLVPAVLRGSDPLVSVRAALMHVLDTPMRPGLSTDSSTLMRRAIEPLGTFMEILCDALVEKPLDAWGHAEMRLAEDAADAVVRWLARLRACDRALVEGYHRFALSRGVGNSAELLWSSTSCSRVRQHKLDVLALAQLCLGSSRTPDPQLLEQCRANLLPRFAIAASIRRIIYLRQTLPALLLAPASH